MTLKTYSEVSVTSSKAPYLVLPECFYAYSATISSLSLSGVLVTGDETHADPFERLAKSVSPVISSFSLAGSIGSTYNGNHLKADLNHLARLMPTASLRVEGLDRSTAQQRRTIVPVTFTISSGYTNETLGPDFCDFLTMNAGLTSMTIRSEDSTKLYRLPECFFFFPPASINSIKFSNLIIVGNVTYSDPLARLVAALNANPTQFGLLSSKLITASGDLATINWSVILPLSSSLTRLDFTYTNLGTGVTLPTFPSAISQLFLTGCGLTGAHPPNLFATVSATPLSTLSVKLDENALTGSLPSGLLASVDLRTLTSLTFWVSLNQLTGTIPSNLFVGSLVTATDVSINLERNLFSGSLESIFASTAFSPENLNGFTFQGSNNNFTGTVPAWLNSMPSLVTFATAALKPSILPWRPQARSLATNSSSACAALRSSALFLPPSSNS